MSKFWNRKWKQLALIPVGVIVTLLMMAAACTNASTTTASCAFVVGDGSPDANLHYIVWRGQGVTIGADEDIYYVPCNSRNYIVNDGTQIDANGNKVGDRHQLIEATTKTGVPIKIAARALWTLNQSEVVLRQFYQVCHKYQCASTSDVGGEANFSTPGWNGMLAENFGPTLDRAAKRAAFKVSDDSIWKDQNQDQYVALENEISTMFAEVMRGNLGYSTDLFCGSGNSDWTDPSRPGQGEFNCSPVRIFVDKVQRGDFQADESAEGIKAINQQRLENAKALYGAEAEHVLGVQDTIKMCKDAGIPCIVNVGGAGSSPAVVVQTANPTPVPVPTPEKTE